MFLILVLTGNKVWAADWYYRLDGGTSTQCTGLTNAPYTGGTAQPCAFNHPGWATGMYDVATVITPRKWASGDRLIAGRAGDSFKMNDSQFPGCGGSPDCHMIEPPDGISATQRTQILGYGWESGCGFSGNGFWTGTGAAPTTSWYGSTNLYNGVIYLGGLYRAGGGNGTLASGSSGTGAKHVSIQCIDITDHDVCVGGGTNPPGPSCGADYARDGIKGRLNDDIELKHVNIHGLQLGGGIIPGGSNWTFYDVHIKNNGYVGIEWERDNADQDRAVIPDGSLFIMDYSEVTGNGCGETWPSLQRANCWGQTDTRGGYGDGIAFQGPTGNDTGIGQWIVTNSSLSQNTQDGFDGLHAFKATDFFHMSYSLVESNGGNQLKLYSNSLVENSFIIDSCNYFASKSYTASDFIAGRAAMCRPAGHSAVAVGAGATGVTYKFTNSTITSIGDVMFMTFGLGCTINSLTRVVLRNNVLIGGKEYNDDSHLWPNVGAGDDSVSFFYNAGRTDGVADTCDNGTSAQPVLDGDYNQLWNFKEGAGLLAAEPHSRYANPLVVGTFNSGPSNTVGYSSDDVLFTHLYLSSTSPSRYTVTGANTADESVSFFSDGSVDFNHFSRGTNWDGGAVQFGTTGGCTANNSACTTNGQCCSGNCTSGTCQAPQTCFLVGQMCSVSADCCSPNTCVSSVCTAPCLGNSNSCTLNSQCCSSNCASSVCQAQCTATGSACGANSDCCTGVCNCNGVCATSSCQGQGNAPNKLYLNGTAQCTGSIQLN